jgi:hypothetical protein
MNKNYKFRFNKFNYKRKRKKFKNSNRNIGFLLYFKRHSNIFLVLSDLKRRHIITLTGGSCNLGKKKKDKMAVHNMSKMINKLLVFLNKLKIRTIYLIVRQRIKAHFFNLRKLLIKNNIFIKGYKYILRKPHGFLRGRKPRRI